MIKLIVLSTLLNMEDVGNIYATIPTDNLTGKIYAGRRRGKGSRGDFRRGGSGLK